MSNTILLKGSPLIKEKVAAAALSPGHCLERTSADKVQKQATADSDAGVLIALENDLIGDEITDAYASGDIVRFIAAQPGDEVQVRLPAAAVAVVIGDKLEFDATGCVNKIATGVAKFVALEAVDNSVGGSEAFIKVEVL